MKKSLLLSVLFSGILSFAQAQFIPNAAFESWTQYTFEYPDGWTTSDSVTQSLGGGTSAFKGSDSYGGGAFSLHLRTTTITLGLTGPGIATNGIIRQVGVGFEFSGGTPDTSRSEMLNGFFKYTPHNSTDAAIIKVHKMKWNGTSRDTIATGQTLFTDTVASFTSFAVLLNYRDTVQPDTSLIIIQSSRGISDPQIAQGSEFVVDSLSFAGFVGIDELNNPVSSVNVYPSPASDKITVDIETSKNISINYSVYDLSGRLINSGAMKSLHEVIDVNSFAEGSYMLKLSDSQNRTLRSVSFLISR